tara:strand:+ start:511 stop:867 length:357 start_codon:yes stop_codon:yes gene_type:complete
MSDSEGLITDAQTVNFEEQRLEEAQNWMARVVAEKGSLANVVDMFKRYIQNSNSIKQFVERTQRENEECQQDLAACQEELEALRAQGGGKSRKSRKPKKRRKRKTHRRKTRKKRTKRR